MSRSDREAARLRKIAIDVIWQRVQRDGPPEPRVVHSQACDHWDAITLQSVSHHELSVLGRSSDIVVFFDEAGNVVGWRDDGRTGTRRPTPTGREAFRQAVVAELNLPRETRLGRLRAVRLPPVGWTHEGVLLLSRLPAPRDVLRVWARPGDLKVIQCLYGPPDVGGGKP